MRPTTAFERFAQFISAAQSGLPCSGDVVYNHLQNLPVSTRLEAGRPSGQSPKAAMEPIHTKRDELKTRAADQAPVPPGGETRAQRLARIRREIQDGVYETPEKLEAAIERMLGVLVE